MHNVGHQNMGAVTRTENKRVSWVLVSFLFYYLSAGNIHVEFVKIHQITQFLCMHFCIYVTFQYNLEKEG